MGSRKQKKTITRFIGDVYRFPNMLVENKNPPACGTDGEYRTKQTKFKHRESRIKHPPWANDSLISNPLKNPCKSVSIRVEKKQCQSCLKKLRVNPCQFVANSSLCSLCNLCNPCLNIIEFSESSVLGVYPRC